MAKSKSTKLRVEYIADADETEYLVVPTAWRIEDLDVYLLGCGIIRLSVEIGVAEPRQG